MPGITTFKLNCWNTRNLLRCHYASAAQYYCSLGKKKVIQKHLISIRFITKVPLVMGKREKWWNNCLWPVDGQQRPLLAELQCQKRTGKLWANVPGNINVWTLFHIDRKQSHVSCFPVSAVSRQDWVIASLFCQQSGQLLGYPCHLLVKYYL